MRDQVDHLKDLNRDRTTACSNKPEVADIWFQSGLPDGFSMEWVIDRYDHTVAETGGHM